MQLDALAVEGNVMKFKLVKRIAKKGWPVYTKSGKISKKWKKAHPAANKAVLRRMGSKIAKQVNQIHTPFNELLGSHTKGGKIIISGRVPRHLRQAIALHENVEHRIMTPKKR